MSEQESQFADGVVKKVPVSAPNPQKGFLISKTDKPMHYENGKKSVLFQVVIFILLSSMMERSAYYWTTASMSNYFKNLGVSNLLSNNLQSTFQAIVYIMPIATSFIVDSFLGRFIVLPISFWMCFIGTGLLAIGDYQKNNGLIYFALFALIAIFDAPIKPNLMVLGGDQFDLNNEKQAKEKNHMFQMYYWFTNIAAGIAFLVAPAIAQDGLGAIPKERGYFYTYIIAFSMYTVGAIIITITGLFVRMFWVRGAEGSVIPRFLKTSFRAAKKDKKGLAVVGGFFLVLISVLVSIPNFFITGQTQSIINYVIAALVAIAMTLMIVFGADASWVKEACDGTLESIADVNEVATVWRLMPYLSFCFPFWAVYNQMNTNMINLSCTMNNYFTDDLGIDGSVMAAASLPTVNSFVIVLVIPILDYGFFPLLEKYGGVKDTLLRRMGAGLVATALSMVSGLGVELYRKSVVDAATATGYLITPCGPPEIAAGWCNPDSTLPGFAGWTYQEGVNDIMTIRTLLSEDPTKVGFVLPVPKESTAEAPLAYALTRCRGRNNADEPLMPWVPLSDASVWLMTIPYGIIGLAEVLFAAVCTDFFYSEVPPSVRSIMQALNMLTVSLGTLLGGIIDVLFKKAVPLNLNEGHVEYVFITIAILAALMSLCFMFVARGFVTIDGFYVLQAPRGDAIDSSSSSLSDDGSKSESEQLKVKSAEKTVSSSSSSPEE